MDFYKLITHLLDSTHRPVNESEDESITNQKREWFVDRTNRHIDLVRKSAHKIVGSYPEFKALLDQVKHHDESKFNEPEMTPYIGISWSHKIGNETGNKPAPTKEENEATLHHITTNSHHPEYHLKGEREANISDQSKKCVDVSSMPDLDIVEMVADWQAMSEELGTNTSRQWFNKVQDVRWQFSQHQVKLIDTILKVFEDTNESVNEEGSAAPAAPAAAQASPGSSGTTTEDNISYLPARMGERGKSKKVKKKRRKRKKRKRDLVGESLVNERGGFIYPSGKAVNMPPGGEHSEEVLSDPNLGGALQYRIYNNGTLIVRLNSSPTTAQLISLKKEVEKYEIRVDSIELDMEYKNPKDPTISKQLGSEPWVTISPVPWNWTSIIQNRYNNALRNSKITEDKFKQTLTDAKCGFVWKDGSFDFFDPRDSHDRAIHDFPGRIREKNSRFIIRGSVINLRVTHKLSGVEIRGINKLMRSLEINSMIIDVFDHDISSNIITHYMLDAPLMGWWRNVNSNYGQVSESLIYERERMLREAINKDLESLRSDFKVQLNKLFDGESFLLLGNHLSSWKVTFGVSAFRTNKVAVPVENKSRGIQNIYGKLLREYGKDKGNLEMLISAIQDGRQIGRASCRERV